MTGGEVRAIIAQLMQEVDLLSASARGLGFQTLSDKLAAIKAKLQSVRVFVGNRLEDW